MSDNLWIKLFPYHHYYIWLSVDHMISLPSLPCLTICGSYDIITIIIITMSDYLLVFDIINISGSYDIITIITVSDYLWIIWYHCHHYHAWLSVDHMISLPSLPCLTICGSYDIITMSDYLLVIWYHYYVWLSFGHLISLTSLNHMISLPSLPCLTILGSYDIITIITMSDYLWIKLYHYHHYYVWLSVDHMISFHCQVWLSLDHMISLPCLTICGSNYIINIITMSEYLWIIWYHYYHCQVWQSVDHMISLPS